MHIRIIIFLFILLPIFVFGQLEDSLKRDELLVVSAEKMNVMYIGIYNPVKIEINGIDSKYIAATINEGELLRVSDVSWMAKVVTPGKVRVKVFVEKDGLKKTYGIKEFRVKRLPSPVVMLAGRRFDFIEKEDIKSAPYLMAGLEDYSIDGIAFYIQSYTFTISDGVHSSEVKCTGNLLPQEVLDLIKKANVRDLITFSDILVKFPNNEIRYVEPLNLIIK